MYPEFRLNDHGNIMPKLCIVKPSGGTEDLPLTKSRYSIGRFADNDIHLNDSDISRHHCLLQIQNSEYIIEDLGSHNGTFLNGRKVDKATLNHGDRVKIGHHVILFLTGDLPPSLSESGPYTIDENYDELLSTLTAPVHEFREKIKPVELKRLLEKEQKTFLLLLDLSNALSMEHSVEDVCRKATDFLLESTEAENAWICLLHQDQKTLVPVISRSREENGMKTASIVLSRTITDRILNEHRGIVTSDALADERFAHGQSIADSGLRSVACAPLLGKSGTFGIIYMQNNTEVGVFTQEDLRLLCAVASQIGLAIENARFSEELKKTNENLERLVEERTAALAQTQMKLYQTEKIASLSRLVAGVAHEINNPLGALKSNLDLLTGMTEKIAAGSAQNPDESEQLGSLTELGRTSSAACARIMSVVRSLSSFAHLDKAALKMSDINSGIRNTVQLMDPLLAADVDIELKLGEIPPTHCYPALLNEAFMNLLVNACQAIEGSGRVTIETCCEDNNIIVKIQDTGCGIPQDRLQTIFDPGFTTKGRGVGVGLGLPIVSSVIREHKGSVEVESETGKGSLFTIRLPVYGA